MPERAQLPNGEFLEFPEGMTDPDEMRNFFDMAAEQVKDDKPVAVGIPGVVSPRKVPAEKFRGVTDLAGEVGGSLLGAMGGSLAGPFGAVAGAGAGAVGGRKGAQMLQRGMGVKPSKFTADDAMGAALVGGIGEGIGRLPFAGYRGLKAVTRAGADTGAAKANQKLLFDIGIENPRLDLLLTDAGAKFDFGAVKQWASKNPFSSGMMKRSADDAAEQMAQGFERRWVVRGGVDDLIPDIEMAGEAFREGLERINPAWREIGNAKYARFFDRMPRGTDVAWDNTKKFLETRGSLDDIVGSLVTDKTKKLHRALSQKYTENFTRSVFGAKNLELVRPMPYEQMKALRTQVGHLISEWGPTAKIPQAELKGLHRALTDDMREVAAKFGALDEFEDANKFWHSNLKRQEEIFNKIDGKLKSDLEVGGGIERLVKAGKGQGDSKRIAEIKTAFDAESDEWATIQNYLMREMGTGSDGNFNIRNVYKGWNRLTESSKRALLGRGKSRKAMDKYLEAVDKFGYNITDLQRSPFSRWTKAEMFGPATMLLGGAGILGGGVATAKGQGGVGVPLAIAGTLAIISPRAAAKLITDPKWTNWAVGASSRAPEAVAGSISRTISQFATAPPDTQSAMIEFFTAFGDVFPEQQQGRGNPPGAMSGQGR